MNLTGKPEAKALTSVVLKLTFLPGLETNERSLITGRLFLYFMPNHKRRVAMLSGVTSTGFSSGPAVEPLCIDERKPSLYKLRATCKCNLDKGTEVRPIFTFVQFFKWAQKLARLDNDMLVT